MTLHGGGSSAAAIDVGLRPDLSAMAAFGGKAAGQGVSAPGGRTDMSHLLAEVAFDPERLSSSVRQD